MSIDALELAASVNSGRLPAGAGVELSHAAIRAANGRLNAVVDFDPDAATEQVEALERRLRAGERPPLAGVPVTVKDHIFVRGWPATEGSLLYRHRIATEDEPVVARLRQAGAIIVGRTNMSEFGCKGVTTNRLYGPTRHPLDSALTPGGSSGGAASAVAAGLAPLALASDGGGSVRRPAAHVGAVGFKPSTGAIADPRAFSHTSVFGIIAATVAEASAMFEALAGRNPRDPVAVALPDEASAGLDGLRLAWAPRLGLDVPVDRDVEDALANAVDRLAAAGFAIRRADPDWPAGAGEDALMPIQHAQLAAAFGAEFQRAPERFDPDIGTQIESGLRLSAADMCRAMEISLGIARAAAAFFAGGFDLLLSPTTPCVAWPLDRLGPKTIAGVSAPPRGHAVFTPFFNHAFCPAISIPAGLGRDGLPVGLQIAGPRLSDRLVLRVAVVAQTCLADRAAP